MKSAYQIKKEPKAKPRNIIDISLGVQTGPCSTPLYIQGYPQRMRLKRRLYGICLVRFIQGSLLAKNGLFLCLII